MIGSKFWLFLSYLIPVIEKQDFGLWLSPVDQICLGTWNENSIKKKYVEKYLSEGVSFEKCCKAW